jgi:lipopolysaccharide transport system permease protein
VARRDQWLLLWSFTRRQVVERYRGSALGIVWAFVNPLVALALWTFLLTTVLRLRHEGQGGASGYATMLWAGMIPWMAFSEAINGAMNCIRGHGNLVKRSVFPIEVLPLAAVFSGFIHSLFALSILLPVLLYQFHGIPWQAALLPVVVVVQLVFTAAIAYPVSVATTLVRDTVSIFANLLTTLMYVTPIIYPIESIPEGFYRKVMLLNPLAAIVISYRRVLLDGVQPPWQLLAVHGVVWAVVLVLMRSFFQRQRRTFAEIL